MININVHHQNGEPPSLRRAVRSGLYSADDPSFSQLVGRQLICKNTVQPTSRSVQTFTWKKHNLRPRSHSFSL